MDGATLAAVLSLGQQIATNLDERDLLSRWMAHHLAGCLAELELLDGSAKKEAEASVAQLIVQIWEHRQAVKFHYDALALADSVERAVARLDPSSRGPFGFYPTFDEVPGPTAEEIEVNSVLKVALGIENAAQDLIRTLVKYAALVSLDQDAEWVKASQAVKPLSFRELSRLTSFDSADDEAADPLSVERIRIAADAQSIAGALRALAEILELSSTEQPEKPNRSRSRRNSE